MTPATHSGSEHAARHAGPLFRLCARAGEYYAASMLFDAIYLLPQPIFRYQFLFPDGQFQPYNIFASAFARPHQKYSFERLYISY